MSNERILLVDDDPSFADLLRGYLETAGFAVLSAPDASTAIKLTRQENPDLIISALTLPDCSGISLITIFHTDIGLDKLPIIILSDRDTRVDKLAALESGAADFLTKPISGREIVARVRAILRRVQRVKDKSQLDLTKTPDPATYNNK